MHILVNGILLRTLSRINHSVGRIMTEKSTTEKRGLMPSRPGCLVHQPEHSGLAQGLFRTYTFHHTVTGQEPGFSRLKIRFGAPHPRSLVSELFCTGGRWRGEHPPGWFLQCGDLCLRSILFRLKLLIRNRTQTTSTSDIRPLGLSFVSFVKPQDTCAQKCHGVEESQRTPMCG